MANEIALQFKHRKPDDAAAEIALHLRRFWDPRMRADLLHQAETQAESLDPLIQAAAKLLA